MQKIKYLILICLLLCSLPAHAKFANIFKGRLSPEKKQAAIGSAVDYVLALGTTERFNQIEVTFKVSDGLELVKGEKVQKIDNLTVGKIVNFYYKVRVIAEGEQRIIASVKPVGLSKDVQMGTTFVAIINPAMENEGYSTVDSDGTKAIVK